MIRDGNKTENRRNIRVLIAAGCLAGLCLAPAGCSGERDPAYGTVSQEEIEAKKAKILRDLYPQASPKATKPKAKKGR
ncbi:MAG: hypothetical protein ABS79_07125 [Planctomycetes bacterium SCN 63-9]|nr:MAG: hypothetical protein ABS79_07125 [Planctomycetes bacterium SCN 63-9]